MLTRRPTRFEIAFPRFTIKRTLSPRLSVIDMISHPIPVIPFAASCTIRLQFASLLEVFTESGCENDKAAYHQHLEMSLRFNKDNDSSSAYLKIKIMFLKNQYVEYSCLISGSLKDAGSQISKLHGNTCGDNSASETIASYLLRRIPMWIRNTIGLRRVSNQWQSKSSSLPTRILPGNKSV